MFLEQQVWGIVGDAMQVTVQRGVMAELGNRKKRYRQQVHVQRVI